MNGIAGYDYFDAVVSDLFANLIMKNLILTTRTQMEAANPGRAAALQKLKDICTIMSQINRFSDVNSNENMTELKDNVNFIVDHLMPFPGDNKADIKKHIFGGMFAVISKAYDYEIDNRLPRNNTTLVVGQPKRARRGR